MQSGSDRSTVRVYLRGALAVVGCLLLVSSILLGYTGFTDTYKHDATLASEWDQEETPETVLTDLTPPEQAVVLESRANSGPAWRSDPVGLRFSYPPGPESAGYTVEVGNTRYALETAVVQRPVTMLVHALQVSFVAAGLLLLVAGIVPIVRYVGYPDTPLSEPFQSLLFTWMPVWALLAVIPAGAFALIYPIVLETVRPIPFNLFVAPFLVSSSICALISMGLLRKVDLAAPRYLLSVLNASFLWALVVSLYVSPASGESRATLTLFLFVSSLSVFVGLSVGWYTRRWRKIKESEYPNEPEYWRI